MKDLMTPRYEVIADYPNTEFNVGEIIEFEVNEETGVLYTPISSEDDTTVGVDYFKQYPHLFRPLAWYEKRDIKDMPEYVKFDNNGRSKIVVQVDWNRYNEIVGKFYGVGNDFTRFIDGYLPATQSEYEAYINSKR